MLELLTNQRANVDLLRSFRNYDVNSSYMEYH